MRFVKFLAAAVGIGLLPGAGQAATVAALTGDATLAIVDTEALKVTRTVTVTGAGGPLVGIDVRPADGALYGLLADGTVVTIDWTTGATARKAKLEKMPAAGSTVTVDFNPVADRLRVIGSDGSNLRANVDDGKVVTDGNLKFADSDTSKGKSAKVVAGAYTNSVKGATQTTLYDIDSTTAALVKQAPPNDGVLGTVGNLGMAISTVAFDIGPDGKGGEAGWLLAGGTLYSVDLASGKTTKVGTIAGNPTARDMAVIPAR
ncbi:DUF4394 domain-containing protein [Reyranella sp. CPCC 100927]|uniref:DUF4394 domain-containing protein n=1 Tax=Reyranella sp. CPCC 100927 TaxID=2599616 RepID=UPI0011B3F1AE|nr:DUF4394 domain-containing protein [Reyranella sp. CPCC 100927]TWT14925.1 DUF4394 domain-containing protein [Reyranella sp. CPCC 100927]